MADDRQPNGSSSLTPSAPSVPRPLQLDMTVLGTRVHPDMTRVVGNFLARFIDRPNIEIEAKLGFVLAKSDGRRANLPVLSACVLFNNDQAHTPIAGGNWYRFESNMEQRQYQFYNDYFNQRVHDTHQSGYRDTPVNYVHTKEIDRFYPGESGPDGKPGGKIRVTYDRKTDKVVNNGIVQKVRLANLDIFSPQTPFDFRISVSTETPVAHPTTQCFLERNKDRLSYAYGLWNFDLTYVKTSPVHQDTNDKRFRPYPTSRGNDRASTSFEVEVELRDPKRLVYEHSRLRRGDTRHQYHDIVQSLLDNVQGLAAKYRS
ncbi:mRNA-capping enzyme subunit beta [Dimargaris verticillata]|uniref:mRNA-capping enzyme subunit beta n=1 Tax=Dimargaris verticillata TaxID=2761393 RepID=A0A9W8EDI4_9FUNG|nr:mRNA-capping enzyme subunit beta [Dimargaris verticillata]